MDYYLALYLLFALVDIIYYKWVYDRLGRLKNYVVRVSWLLQNF